MNARVIVLPVLLAIGLLVSRPCAAAPIPGVIPGDYCNARDEPRVPWTRDAKRRTQTRVERVLGALRVAPIIRAFHRVVICREAFCGEASVRHTLGGDVRGREDGLGAYGLSLRWHKNKWPGEDLEPALCTIEVSTVIAHELMWRAVTRYGARNLAEVQAVYAGAVSCVEGDCRFELSLSKRRGFCERLSSHGYDCAAPITEQDLGRRLGPDERQEWALAQARAWVAGWLGRDA